MTAVDREYVLGVMNTARDMQESRAQVFTEKRATALTLEAENRSYSLALLIDALDAGLLEQLHVEAEQRLFLDMVVDQDAAWDAYFAGMAAPPESTAPVTVAVDDIPAGGAL